MVVKYLKKKYFSRANLHYNSLKCQILIHFIYISLSNIHFWPIVTIVFIVGQQSQDIIRKYLSCTLHPRSTRNLSRRYSDRKNLECRDQKNTGSGPAGNLASLKHHALCTMRLAFRSRLWQDPTNCMWGLYQVFEPAPCTLSALHHESDASRSSLRSHAWRSWFEPCIYTLRPEP